VDVVGLGYRKVFQMSVGAISALHGARRLALVGNVLDDLVLRLLGLFPVPISFLVFRGTEKEASRGARSVVDSAARERTALVTRGHPLVFGLLAGLIVEKTAASGVPCRVWDGVSGFDELPALCGPSGAKSRGFQVAGAFDSADCDPELPLVAYLPREERGLAALTRALKKLRPAGATCHFAANTGPGEYAPRAAAADELGDALKDQLPCTVYCP
jgi:hypothetical protein